MSLIHGADVAGPRAPPAPLTHEQAADALRMPVDLGAPLAYALGSEPFLVVVNDHHRPTPTPLLLDWLDRHLKAHGAGLLERGALVAVATGSHAPPSSEALRALLGAWAEPLLSRGRVRVHDARSPDALDAGRTRRGTPLRVDAALGEYPTVVSLNSVEPHYFAGYTGTRKSVFPGLADRASVEANHRLALRDDVAPRRLDGNPLAEDLAEAAARVLRSVGARGLALNVVSVGATPYAAASGSFEGVLQRLAPAADHVFGAPVEGTYDVVVARARPPYSRALYRCMKAFEHARLALRPGGALVLDAPCEEGLGAFNGVALVREHGTRERAIEAVEAAYALGAHQAVRLFRYLAAGNRLVMATPGLAADDVRALGATPARDAAEGVETAARELGLAAPRVLVLEDATNVVPVR